MNDLVDHQASRVIRLVDQLDRLLSLIFELLTHQRRITTDHREHLRGNGILRALRIVNRDVQR